MQQYHNITACPLNIQEYNKKYDIITTYCIEFILPLYLSYITPNMDIIKKLENCLTYRLFNYIEHINSQTNDYDHLYPIKLLIVMG